MSNVTIDDLRNDVAELEKFFAEASRQKVRSILTVEAHKLRTEITQRLEQEKSNGVTNKGDTDERVTKAPAKANKYAANITSYAWDQSDKFFKVYVTLKDAQKCSKENVTSEFTDSSFKVKVTDLDGKDHLCHVAHLYGDIVPEKSYHKVKTDMVLVMLKKTDEKTWAFVTQKEAKAKERKTPAPGPGPEKDPQGGLMDLMKQMYDDGDDEMKRTIAKSMYESQQKKSTVDMPGMGMPDMPGMGMPNMPGMGMPNMPGMGMPNMPGMGMPNMPGMGMPNMPGMGMPNMPGMGMPNMPDMPDMP